MFISQAYHCNQVLHEEKSSSVERETSKANSQINGSENFFQKLKQVFNVKKRVFQSY
ncbi:hypothetical protein ACFFU1_12160 [Algibacter miyuki]|uniref:Uncharacterized protein n=1 Tax=Algibacter miyuki TaxID=1306933 RepID=A0ABV5H191_9FLAO